MRKGEVAFNNIFRNTGVSGKRGLLLEELRRTIDYIFKQKYAFLAVAVALAMIFALSLDTIFCFIYNV